MQTRPAPQCHLNSLPAMSPAPEMVSGEGDDSLKRGWCATVWCPIRKGFVLLIGLTVLLAGIVMIVTPGPAIVVIPLGLAILATEFIWAKHLLHFAKAWIAKRYHQLKGDRPVNG